METKFDVASFNETLETMKDTSIQTKDYIKFIVALSTGTILLSVTFVKDFIKFPQYNFILIIGWILLFVSIVLGVWILPGRDKLHLKFDLMKRLVTHPEEFLSISKKELRELYVKELIKGMIPSKLREDEKFKDFCNSLENRRYEDLTKLASHIGGTTVKEEYKNVSKNFIKAILDMFSLLKDYEDEAYLPNLVKDIKSIHWQLKYLEKGMKYSFFIGMLSILVFSIINLIAKA